MINHHYSILLTNLGVPESSDESLLKLVPHHIDKLGLDGFLAIWFDGFCTERYISRWPDLILAIAPQIWLFSFF